jgi:hypothetical protein
MNMWTVCRVYKEIIVGLLFNVSPLLIWYLYDWMTCYFFFTGSTAPWTLASAFQFHDHFTGGRTPWTSDQLVARPLPKHRTTQKQNKHIHTPNIHALSGIRTHNLSVRTSEDSSCLRPLCCRDRWMTCYSIIYLPLHLKVNLSLCLINKAERHGDVWDSGGIAPPFLTSVLDGGEWSVSRPSRFTLGEKASYSLEKMLGWPQSRPGCCGVQKNVAPSGNRAPDFQPIAIPTELSRLPPLYLLYLFVSI